MNDLGFDARDYTFKYWLTHNKYYDEIKKGEIMKQYFIWFQYGEPGQFAVWLSGMKSNGKT